MHGHLLTDQIREFDSVITVYYVDYDVCVPGGGPAGDASVGAAD